MSVELLFGGRNSEELPKTVEYETHARMVAPANNK